MDLPNSRVGVGWVGLLERDEMKLNDVMEFDHVIRVGENGEVTDVDGIYAPNLLDGELDGSAWEFVTQGYTRQDSYSGPIMHDSEFIGGQLERDILAEPGVYVAVVAYYSPEDGEDEYMTEGWAIVRLRQS